MQTRDLANQHGLVKLSRNAEIDSFLADLESYEQSLDLNEPDLPVLLKLHLNSASAMVSYEIDYGLCFTFTDGSKLTLKDVHYQDCCENVYADWQHIKPFLAQDFKSKSWQTLEVLEVAEAGFVIKLSVFVPCYNEQNGCYSSSLSLIIEYNGTSHSVHF